MKEKDRVEMISLPPEKKIIILSGTIILGTHLYLSILSTDTVLTLRVHRLQIRNLSQAASLQVSSTVKSAISLAFRDTTFPNSSLMLEPSPSKYL